MFSNIVVLILAAVSSAKSSESECPDVTAVNLDSEFDYGTWYEHGRYPNKVERSQKNIAFNIMPKENGYIAESIGIPLESPDYLTAEGTYVPNQVPNGVVNFTMTCADCNQSINLIIKYLGYDRTYFFAFGCMYDPETSMLEELAWIYGRSPEMTADVQRKVNETIDNNEAVDYDKFIWIDNSNLIDNN